MSLSAAKSRLLFAKSNLESNRIDDVAPMLDAAEGFLQAVSVEEKAPLLAEIAALRSELSSMLRPEDERHLSAAKGKIRQARSQQESRYDAADIQVTLRQAEEFLGLVPDIHVKHKAPLLADIASIRAAFPGAPPASPPAATETPSVPPPPIPAAPPSAPSDGAHEALKQSVEPLQRAANRELDHFESTRRERAAKDLNPNAVASKVADFAAQVRAKIGGARIAELDGWLATIDEKLAELRLLDEAFALFRAEAEVEEYGGLSFTTALDSAEYNLTRNPERTVLAWDAAKKLVTLFENPRFSTVPEIGAALARYRTVAARVDSELRPALAKLRVGPLIEAATHPLRLLERDVDNRDEDRVLEWRRALRQALAPLERDWADQEDAQAFVAKCARAMRRSEEELGEKLVLREIQLAENLVKPLIERVERALELVSANRVRAHAPRLAARRAALAPFLAHQRAKLLDERAEAALARIESVLGSDVAREVAAAESVPRFEIDIAADTKVQACLQSLNRAFEGYRVSYLEAQESFEAEVSFDGGGARYGILRTIESAASTMIRSIRATEETVDELRRVDRAHTALAVVESEVPSLIRRAQLWKERLAKAIEYADAIARAKTLFDDAERSAAPIGDDPHEAKRSLPEVLAKTATLRESLVEVAAILPDDHDEADALAAKSAALHGDAREKLIAACVSTATRLATDGQMDNAREYAAVLRRAVPDAPENDAIDAVIAGTASTRQLAEAEIQERGELIRRRAEESASSVRERYDVWAADKPQLTALAGTIVENIARYRGKWVAAHARHLGVLFYDHHDELNGDVYRFDYDPDVRQQLADGIKRLDGLYAEMATAVAARHGVGGVGTYTQHYPRDAYYLCEIVGVAQYTPRREVRDQYGRVVGSVDGTPYPVPRVVIRAVKSLYFVIVPGHASSLDGMNVDGIVV